MTNLDALIDDFRNANAGCTIMVCTNIVRRFNNSDNITFNTNLESTVSARGDYSSTPAQGTTFIIDMYTLFNRAGGVDLLDDNLHPDDQGYGVMAGVYFANYLAVFGS